jgi:hypothetical protein
VGERESERRCAREATVAVKPGGGGGAGGRTRRRRARHASRAPSNGNLWPMQRMTGLNSPAVDANAQLARGVELICEFMPVTRSVTEETLMKGVCPSATLSQITSTSILGKIWTLDNMDWNFWFVYISLVANREFWIVHSYLSFE